MSFLKHLLPAWKTNLADKTKTNAAILSALEDEITDTEAEAIGTKVLMSLDTATDEWLDKYGNIFGIIRQDEEMDTPYRERIKAYILLERGTIPAIKAGIANFMKITEADIEIYEPYTNIFFLNKSKLNSEDCILGEYFTVAVIDIMMSYEVPPELIGIIKDFKPAGVTVHFSALETYSGGTFTTTYDTEFSGGGFTTTEYEAEYRGGSF